MHKYVIRRLLLAIPVLLLSSLIVFGLMRVMPGDALTALMAESGNVGERELRKLREDLGLGRPYHEQYLIWLWQLVSLNPGYSIFTNEDRKSTRLNSSHLVISYAVFCLKKKRCKSHCSLRRLNSSSLSYCPSYNYRLTYKLPNTLTSWIQSRQILFNTMTNITLVHHKRH